MDGGREGGEGGREQRERLILSCNGKWRENKNRNGVSEREGRKTGKRKGRERESA